VVLNRGNHEDYAICCAYGFQVECVGKNFWDVCGSVQLPPNLC
jgi:hypothetical protein